MPNDPYDRLAPAPEIAVRIPGLEPGGTLPLAQVAAAQGGAERSPQISWEPVAGARSYVVSLYDPDAPTVSGFWHWLVYDIPATTTELAEGAGNPGGTLPEGAVAGLNEALGREYIGAAPPEGDGPHRYFFTVSALDTPSLGIPADADVTAARVHFMLRTHVIARGQVVGVWRNPRG